MTELETIRHSAAHVLATAILKIWPEAQFAAGPPVDQGFYYDVELPHRITPEDFARIEEEMKNEVKANHPFERVEVSRDEAVALAEQGALASLGARGEPSKFKLDIVRNIPEGETPLGLLLRDNLKLAGDVTVTGIERMPGQIQVTLVRTDSPGDGSLSLVFADNPLALRQWTVLDAETAAWRRQVLPVGMAHRSAAQNLSFMFLPSRWKIVLR